MSAIAVAAGVVVLVVIAGLAAVIGVGVWLVSGAAAVLAGLLIKAQQRRLLVLTLIPATLLTNSNLVPHNGRYVPAVTVLIALLVASRADVGRIATHVRVLPKWLVRVLVAYFLWMVLTALTSTAKEVSFAYVVGSVVTLTIAFLVIPSIAHRSRLLEEIVATLVLTGVVIVVSGVLLALAGSIQLYGKSVGLYFITEATLLGHPTGLIFLQDYGPFVGPETTPLALGLAGVLYLRSVSEGRMRLAWNAAGLILLLGLLSTFSREGWLIVVLTCLALSIPGRSASRIARPALVTSLVMLVIFSAGITNVLGVIGRMDLTADWYGPHAASVLLNPNPTTRGESGSSPPTSSPGTQVTQRTLEAPCVAVESPGAQTGTTTNPTVELKGSSSLLARLCLWETAARAIAHSPIFGYGPGTGSTAIIPFFLGKGAGVVGATTHDTYLRVGVEMGVPGIAIYLALTGIAAWLALACLRRSRVGAEMVLAASVLAITVAELTDTLLFGGLSFPGFWLAMAVGLLAVRPAEEQGMPAGGRLERSESAPSNRLQQIST